jgi:hypothetical protein
VQPAAVEVLSRELRSLVTRLRGFSPPRFAAAAPPFPTRGDVAHHLIVTLARSGTALEGVAVPDVRRLADHVLADQLAVVGADLLAVLADHPEPAVAAAGLGEVVLHRRDLDGSVPATDAVGVLAAAWGCAETVGEVMLAATARCPAYAG